MGRLTNAALNEVQSGIDLINNIGDGFTATLHSIGGFVGGVLDTISAGGDFVGLDYSKEETIRNAIRDYVKNIQKELDGLNDEAGISNAVKGQAAKETKKFVAAVSQVAQAYASSLLVYSDNMHKYAEAYAKNDTDKLSEDIKAETTAMESKAEVYTEKY